MCSLYHRLLIHDLPDQIPVDLAQAAIQHLPSFEHEEDAVGEDWLAMALPVDVEEVLVGCDTGVDFEAERLDVKSQGERVLLDLLVELKICNYRVLRLGFVPDREGHELPLKLASLVRLGHILRWVQPDGLARLRVGLAGVVARALGVSLDEHVDQVDLVLVRAPLVRH